MKPYRIVQDEVMGSPAYVVQRRADDAAVGYRRTKKEAEKFAERLFKGAPGVPLLLVAMGPDGRERWRKPFETRTGAMAQARSYVRRHPDYTMVIGPMKPRGTEMDYVSAKITGRGAAKKRKRALDENEQRHSLGAALRRDR